MSYIGTQPIEKASRTLTQGTFGADAQFIAVPQGYTPGNILLYINGLLWKTTDYDAVDGSVIDLKSVYPAGTDFIAEEIRNFKISELSTHEQDVETHGAPVGERLVHTGDLGTAAPLDVAGAGDAADGEVVLGSDTRLTDARQATNTNTQLRSLGVGTAATGILGEIVATNDITAYSSDVRLKENIEDIPDAINKLQQIRGVSYDWKDECEELGFIPVNKHEHGVIAQEVEKVIPDAVRPAPFNNEYLTVKYDRLIPLLIEAIKEQQDQIDELKAKVGE